MLYHIPTRVLPIQGDGFHLSLKAMVDGHDLHMLIDTGASRTVFDRETLIDLLSLTEEDIEHNTGPSGGIGATRIESSVTTLRELNLGGCVFHDYPAALIDLSHVNQLFSNIGLSKVDGILGGDVLMQARAVIDYARETLTLKRRKPRQSKKASGR